MKTYRKLLCTILIAALISGCGSTSSATDETMQTLSSSKMRNLTPDVTTAKLQNLATANNAFALEMMAKLRASEDGNLFFSPYSISEAMVMAYAGAANETKNQMRDVLHFDNNDTLLHTSFNALDLHLNQSEGNYTFTVANAIWPQQEFTILDSYLDTLTVNYGASLFMMDYQNHAGESVEIINNWVEAKTNDRIQDLITFLDPSTRVVLTNAVYFKAKWLNAFKEYNTKDETFSLIDETNITTAMMGQTYYFEYTENESMQSIKLPYENDLSSMVIILPKDGAFESVEHNLSAYFAYAVSNQETHFIDLKMPKFEFTTPNYSLVSAFESLGLTAAFNGADFSGITGQKDLIISDIIHKAFIKVDEEGTEAAAATAIIFETTGGIVELNDPTPMVLNRPFFFFITDDLSGQILFAGVIENPTS